MAALRIIEVTHAFEPQVGGIETHVQELSLALARRGAEVAVHTSDSSGSKEVDARLAKHGVIVKRHFAVRLPFFSSLVIMPALPFALLLEKGGVVCAHGFGSPIPILAAIGARLSGKRFYWTLHGFPRFSRSGGRAALWLYSHLAAPLAFASSSKLIAVSAPVAAQAKLMAPGKSISVIPNGVSGQFLGKRRLSKSLHPPFTILFVGRLDESKGVRALARAFRIFHVRHPASRLRFVGPDEGERAWLEQFAKTNGLPASFGLSSGPAMPSVYSSASLTVLPSDYEGFGLSVLESWACGTPAVSTPVGAAPEFLRKTFGLRAKNFIFKDEKELLERLEFVHSAKQAARRAWSASARKALSAYTWDSVAKKTIQALEL